MPQSAIVTCGPAYEPIDAVRRITNHSTGELGAALAEALAADGFDVLCLRGEMATFPAPRGVRMLGFSTNESLRAELEKIHEPPAAVFHAAALGDFAVAGIEGAEITGKIKSTTQLRITLRPAAKILPDLRDLFPESLIVGWKYELDGTRPDVLARGHKQIATARTDACVVNGAAYGPGFGFLEPGASDEVRHLSDKAALSAFLCAWTKEQITLRSTDGAES
jgi:phosphopantothenoylcysteine synthetase/decarboxylase